MLPSYILQAIGYNCAMYFHCRQGAGFPNATDLLPGFWYACGALLTRGFTLLCQVGVKSIIRY